ncbi:MAG TPA: hypothetical protein PLD47_00635 [Aggregatilineales bacterium]|nr:hypothetical protein [Anaerolineales bacterium]HRE46205.1 hypothetical protein [Aggregatilineales bacterium]
MSDSSSMPIHILATVRLPSLVKFRETLAKEPKFRTTIVTSAEAARTALADREKALDVFVVDNNIPNTDVYEWIKQLRSTHPRLLILLVDEEADFGTPGRADDVTTTPFKDDELIKKIKRMAEERSLATLRADSLPPIRDFAKALRKANKSVGKQQAAVSAVRDMGYDYVVFYTITPGDPPALSLAAQEGDQQISSMMPIRTDYENILGSVVRSGQPKIINTGDSPSHFLIDRGRFGAAVAIPVGTTLRFGVLIAFRPEAGSIKQESIVMLELICAQLASALAKEQRGG